MMAYWRRNKTILRDGFVTMLVLAPFFAAALSLFTSAMSASASAPADVERATTDTNDLQTNSGYVEYGRDIDTRLFSLRLPPPPLDALPYDVRTPLDNGPDVDVKRRWLWIPDGQSIQVLGEGDAAEVIVPAGSMW